MPNSRSRRNLSRARSIIFPAANGGVLAVRRGRCPFPCRRSRVRAAAIHPILPSVILRIFFTMRRDWPITAQAITRRPLRLQESLTDDYYWHGTVLSYPVAAMAFYRSGKLDQADEMLSAADKAGDRWAKEMVEGPVGTMPVPWFDWIEFTCLEREAQQLIKGSARRCASKMREIEQAALAAIRSQ